MAIGAPDATDEDETDDEEDEEAADDEDEELLTGVAAVELTAPVVAAPRCAEAGRATAIAAAAAALSTPVPEGWAAPLRSRRDQIGRRSREETANSASAEDIQAASTAPCRQSREASNTREAANDL